MSLNDITHPRPLHAPSEKKVSLEVSQEPDLVGIWAFQTVMEVARQENLILWAEEVVLSEALLDLSECHSQVLLPLSNAGVSMSARVCTHENTSILAKAREFGSCLLGPSASTLQYI